MVSLALSTQSGVATYLPLGHQRAFELTLEGENQEEVKNLSGLNTRQMAEIKAILEDPGIEKCGYDLKQTALSLARMGVILRGISFDVMIASYLCDPGSRDRGVASLALKELSRTVSDRKDLVGTGSTAKPFSDVSIDQAGDYLCEITDVLVELVAHLKFLLGMEILFLANNFLYAPPPYFQSILDLYSINKNYPYKIKNLL